MAALAQAPRDLAARPPSPYDRDALYPSPLVIYGLLNAGWLKPDPQNPGGHSGIGSSERSRLGFRATEILDRGWRAHMLLEQSFRLDDGSWLKANRPFNAGASVGLSERRLGRVDVGRLEQAASTLVLRADPWGGTTAVGPGARLYRIDPQADSRSSAMLSYSSPVDQPERYTLQASRPGPATDERPGHGGSLAWDRLPWLAGIGYWRTSDGARNLPVVIGHDDGTRHFTVALTDGRVQESSATRLLHYRNVFVGLALRRMGLGDPERHEWRVGLDVHRVEGDADGRLGSDTKVGLGWRYRFSRHTWANLGAAWVRPRLGSDRWGLEASLSYSFERDLRVPQWPR